MGCPNRRVEGLVAQLGIERISRSRVSEMAKELDGAVEALRTRPLDAGPYTRVAGCTHPEGPRGREDRFGRGPDGFTAPFLCFPTSMLAAGHQELAVG